MRNLMFLLLFTAGLAQAQAPVAILGRTVEEISADLGQPRASTRQNTRWDVNTPRGGITIQGTFDPRTRKVESVRYTGPVHMYQWIREPHGLAQMRMRWNTRNVVFHDEATGVVAYQEQDRRGNTYWVLETNPALLKAWQEELERARARSR